MFLHIKKYNKKVFTHYICQIQQNKNVIQGY